jgi:HEAT repeat protein
VIRAAAIEGLAALGDARALELVLRYAAAPNRENVRVSALQASVALGRNDPARRDQLNNLLISALKPGGGIGLRFTAVGGLGAVGDARAIPAIETAITEMEFGPVGPQFRQFAQGVIAQLKTRNQ